LTISGFGKGGKLLGFGRFSGKTEEHEEHERENERERERLRES
jgi:hypothetical protein